MRDELERNHKEINVLLGSFYTRSTAIKHDNAFLSSTPYASPLSALSLSTFVKPQLWLNPFLAIYQCSRSTPRQQTVIALHPALLNGLGLNPGPKCCHWPFTFPWFLMFLTTISPLLHCAQPANIFSVDGFAVRVPGENEATGTEHSMFSCYKHLDMYTLPSPNEER